MVQNFVEYSSFFQKHSTNSKLNMLGKLGKYWVKLAFDDWHFLEVIFLLDLRWGKY
jgi:hypothetical protein